jgi:penicillin-binding protein 1A
VQVAKPTVEAMNDMLSEVMITGTGRRAALAGRQAAGKTGTSQDFRDAWFIGYTAQLTAGVWVGNDSARPMNRVMGGSLPARIWQSVMTAAHEAEPPVPLPGARSAPVETVAAKSAPVAANLSPPQGSALGSARVPPSKPQLKVPAHLPVPAAGASKSGPITVLPPEISSARTQTGNMRPEGPSAKH